MRRRDFIKVVVGSTVTSPLAVRAQQPTVPVIGYLGTGTPSTQGQWIAAFAQRLHELGWIDGQNVRIDVRWAEGRNERFAELATEFVALKVKIIVASGGAVPAIMRATSAIPVIFSGANDPLGSGYVTSLSRPGGNITGLSLESTDLIGKRLELLIEVVPSLKHLAIMGGPANHRSAVLEMDKVKASAEAHDIDVTISEISGAEDISSAFDAIKGKTQALYVVSSPLTTINRTRINTLALGARLPTMFGYQDSVEAGGLISYGADYLDLWRRTADYADKVLRGTKPSDIPVEQPTKFDLVINLTTAKALGLTIPGTVIARADKVIE
jgi:putative tryptophan/tyrosine transport system substrate-binding protein